MAQPAKPDTSRTPFPRSRTFGTAAVSARQQFSWAWSRESVLRLVLSFVLAIALWLYVTGKQDPTLVVEYPQPLRIAPESLAAGLTVTNTLPTVHVWYRNNPTTPITQASFYPYVDLSHLGPGRYGRIPVKVVADPGIQDPSATPSSIPVVIEPLEVKQVRVKVHLLNAPPSGFHVDSVQAQQGVVEVSGPASSVSQVSQAGVYVDLTGARFSIDDSYNLAAENSQGRAVTGQPVIRPSQVRVKIIIVPLSSYKSLAVLVPITGQPKAGYGATSITVLPSEITAKGSPAALSRVSSVSTGPVSITNRGAGTFSTRVRVRLPRGLQTDRQSEWVTVRVQLAPVESSSSIEIGVSPVNLVPGLTAHLQPAKILVTVVGPSSALRRAASHMRATVDAGNLGAGSYQLKPVVTPAPGLKIEGVTPSLVTVALGQ